MTLPAFCHGRTGHRMQSQVPYMRGVFHEGLHDDYRHFWVFMRAGHAYSGKHTLFRGLPLTIRTYQGRDLSVEHLTSELMNMTWSCDLSSPASQRRTDLLRILRDAFVLNAGMNSGSATSVLQGKPLMAGGRMITEILHIQI